MPSAVRQLDGVAVLDASFSFGPIIRTTSSWVQQISRVTNSVLISFTLGCCFDGQLFQIVVIRWIAHNVVTVGNEPILTIAVERQVHFKLPSSAADKISNCLCFRFREGLRSRVDLAAHILASTFAVPLESEIAIGIRSITERSRVSGARFAPHSVEPMCVFVTWNL